MNHKSIICLFLFLYAFTNCLAQKKQLVELTGFIEYDHIAYFEEMNPSIVDSRSQGILSLDLSKEINSKAKVFSSIEIREDFSDKSRNRIFPKEYYFDLTLKNVDLRIGKQKYKWGRADGFNFTNNINPVDFSDLLDTTEEDIGLLSSNLVFYVKDWTIRGVLAPVFFSSIMPNQNSVWFPKFPGAVPNPFIEGQYLHADYTFAENEEPSKKITSAQYAIKVDKTLGPFDLSLSYYNGYSDIPEFVTNQSLIAPDSVSIQVKGVHVPWDVMGADFATAIGPVGLRGEVGYFMTKGIRSEEANSNADFIQYSLGADYLVSLGGGNSSLLLLAEWVHEVVPSDVEYQSSSLNHLFQQAVLSRLEYKYRTIFTFSLQSIIDIKNKGYLLQPKASYDLVDGLNLAVQVDLLGGDETSFFGRYTNNDRVQLKIKYSF